MIKAAEGFYAPFNTRKAESDVATPRRVFVLTWPKWRQAFKLCMLVPSSKCHSDDWPFAYATTSSCFYFGYSLAIPMGESTPTVNELVGRAPGRPANVQWHVLNNC